MKVDGLLAELAWVANFKKKHPRAPLPISVAKLAKLMSQWYPSRYQTVLYYALKEFTLPEHRNQFRWKYVPESWALDNFLGIDYLFSDPELGLIGLDLTTNPNMVQSKCSKHYSLKGIFNLIGVKPYVLVVSHSLDQDFTWDKARTNYC